MLMRKVTPVHKNIPQKQNYLLEPTEFPLVSSADFGLSQNRRHLFIYLLLDFIALDGCTIQPTNKCFLIHLKSGPKPTAVNEKTCSGFKLALVQGLIL